MPYILHLCIFTLTNVNLEDIIFRKDSPEKQPVLFTLPYPVFCAVVEVFCRLGKKSQSGNPL